MRSDWLEAFLVFSNLMNFTNASAQLNISQPALHIKIKKLQDSLGTPLYYKVGRTLYLTPNGERVAAYAREQQQRSNHFIKTLKQGAQELPVTLCAGEGAYSYLLGPALAQFSQTNAKKLRLLSGDQERTTKALLSGEAHIGVSAPEIVENELVAEPLTDVGQMLVLPKNHHLAKKDKVRVNDIHNCELVVPPKGKPHRTMINRILMNANISWKVGVEVNGWELMLQFVRLGFGLAIVNECCRLGAGLVAKPLKEFPLIRYQVLTPRDRDLPASTLMLKEILLKHRDTWAKYAAQK